MIASTSSRTHGRIPTLTRSSSATATPILHSSEISCSSSGTVTKAIGVASRVCSAAEVVGAARRSPRPSRARVDSLAAAACGSVVAAAYAALVLYIPYAGVVTFFLAIGFGLLLGFIIAFAVAGAALFALRKLLPAFQDAWDEANHAGGTP